MAQPWLAVVSETACTSSYTLFSTPQNRVIVAAVDANPQPYTTDWHGMSTIGMLYAENILEVSS